MDFEQRIDGIRYAFEKSQPATMNMTKRALTKKAAYTKMTKLSQIPNERTATTATTAKQRLDMSESEIHVNSIVMVLML